VQFRVGITLDFRGDVATSPAHPVPRPSRSPLPPFSYTSSAVSSTFGGLQPVSPFPLLCVLCFAISAREGHPPLVLQGKSTQPGYLGEIDPSVRATLYIYMCACVCVCVCVCVSSKRRDIPPRRIFLFLLPSAWTLPFAHGFMRKTATDIVSHWTFPSGSSSIALSE